MHSALSLSKVIWFQGSGIADRVLHDPQAYLTTRKQNKKFAVYELNIVLDWKGRWEEDGKEVSTFCAKCMTCK